ncbi:conserved hypothetical protein [Treponema phagedenis]|uniref:Uncharacterized protein n=1 Tax=Treponema phagedenis TaxID=162 RepID=A0A0B7H0B1_TREPH|nr:conserved hypothetical protein [Treponema phagedenis]
MPDSINRKINLEFIELLESKTEDSRLYEKQQVGCTKIVVLA